MYSSTDPAYLQARAIKRQELELAAPHKANGRRVGELFLEYVASHDAARDRTKQRVHPAVGGVFPQVVVAFWALESIEAQVANAKVDADAIAARFEDVVSIHTSGMIRTVWFETDAALAAARSGGITDAISAVFVDAVREHDEFDWFGVQSQKEAAWKSWRNRA